MDRPDEVTSAKTPRTLNSFGAWAESHCVGGRRLLEEVVSGFGGRVEKLAAATSLERAQEVQSAYLKSSYEDFIARSAKLAELYLDLARKTYSPSKA